MGIDAHLSLPPNVQIDDAAKVIGKLLGMTSGLTELPSAVVAGVHTAGRSDMARCADIFIDRKPWPRGILWHFEGPGGRRLIILRSTDENVALLRALCDFFGGTLDESDWDDVAVDYSVPDKSDAENCPEGGPEWDALQHRIHAVQPLPAQKET